MKQIVRVCLTVAAIVFGVASVASAETEDWRLVDANEISSGSYIILTVPILDTEALAAMASEIEDRYGIALAAEWPLRSISVHCFVMDASGHSDINDLVQRMRSDAQIRTAQPMQEFQTFADEFSINHYKDPLVPLQTSLSDLNAVRAHLRSIGSGIRIGVVDSGIDSSHPDLIEQLAESKDFVSKVDGGVAEAHGTAIAGVISASASNQTGMVGIAPGAELVGLRACWQKPGEAGRCSSFSIARSLNFAILNQIPILNLSLGGPPDPLLEELVVDAIGRGMVIVAASGTTGEAAFPASVPGVISAGHRENGGIPAPAVDVITTAPGGNYRFVSGSSIAAAHVSGVVALLLASREDLRSQDVMRALNIALRDREGKPLLDACEALQVVLDPEMFCSS